MTILFFSTIHAETIDSSYEIAIAKAVSNIEMNDFKRAIEILKDVLRKKPEDERATLYLGIALSRSGNRETEEVLKKALLLNPNNPRTNLELGIYYFNRGIHDEAADYFRNTIALAPKSELSEKAEDYLKHVKPVSIEKRWSLNFSLGGQYDNNVVLDSGAGPLPEGITSKSDWTAVLYLKGIYKLLSQKKLQGSVAYSFYQGLNTNLTDFNVTSNLFDINVIYDFTPNLSLKGVYQFEYILVGGNTYDYAHYISPILIVSEGNGFSTELHYRYKDVNYKDSDLFYDNSDRTGFNNIFKIIQNIPIADTALLRLGYSHDVDNAKVSYWSYNGDKGEAELQWNLPHKIFIDLYGEYYVKDYQGIFPGTGKERYDKISTGSISATKDFSERFSVTLGQLYMNNKSNIDIYDYNRAITSLFVNVRF